MAENADRTRTNERVYAVVRQIPPGQVATYGQIAAIVGDCEAGGIGSVEDQKRIARDAGLEGKPE